MTSDATYIQHLVHPTDFSSMSEIAFVHALQLARLARAKLSLIHVAENHDQGRRDQEQWADFPGVRSTLERWGLLPSHSKRADVSSLGILVDKVLARGHDTLSTLLDFIEHKQADFLVLATHQYEGFEKLSRETIAEPLVRQSCVPCLVIPRQSPGFISQTDGAVSVSQIVIPVSEEPESHFAVEHAAALVELLNIPRASFSMLHAGTSQSMPKLKPPEREGWTWNKELSSLSPEEAIVECAKRKSADVIVMVSAGHQTFFDMLRGSTTERVIRNTDCPVLVIPG